MNSLTFWYIFNRKCSLTHTHTHKDHIPNIENLHKCYRYQPSPWIICLMNLWFSLFCICVVSVCALASSLSSMLMMFWDFFSYAVSAFVGQTIKPIHVFTFHSIVFIALMVYTIFFPRICCCCFCCCYCCSSSFLYLVFLFSLIFATDSLFVITKCYLHTKEKHFSSSCQMDNVRPALHNAWKALHAYTIRWTSTNNVFWSLKVAFLLADLFRNLNEKMSVRI